MIKVNDSNMLSVLKKKWFSSLLLNERRCGYKKEYSQRSQNLYLGE